MFYKSCFPHTDWPFFVGGGCHGTSTSIAGVFAFLSSRGDTNTNDGFRACLAFYFDTLRNLISIPEK